MTKLPINDAVELAHRLVTTVLAQYVDEEDQYEARRRIAAKLQEHQPIRVKLGWRENE